MAKSRSVEIPQDFLLALETKDGLAAFFLQYPPSHQNETFKWINEAKKPQTRTSRIEKVVKMLWEKKKKSGE